MLRYVGLLLLVPLLDSLFLVFVATQIGAPLTILLVVLTALLGLLLVRAESRHTIRKIQQKLAVGELPTNELLDGAFLLVAGALTLTPGLVTDAIGILLLVPFTRAPVRWFVREKILVPYMDKKSGGFATGNVYIGGLPFGGDGGPDFGGQGPNVGGQGPGPAGPSDGDAYDLDEDAYDIDFEDGDRDDRRGFD
ncbi:FxsA family protein [Halosimplex pelagicum]|uniref:Membrane protein FxsA n=1 Tax=Halosimplex pelagicum TaxID=869886 RepID=A0A7D5P652_9EURY|nr:FxsA family protein [Halosimplex pelagicum]QLH81863.1 membrane protein FxsA [Halosimplex pelagicum]